MGRRPLRRVLDICINGRLAGFYRYSPSGGADFEYAETWLAWEHGFPISLQLPLRDGVQTGAHVTAVFDNLLPDSEQIRRIIAERTEARSHNPHDLLSAIGRDCIGAMQFVPHGEAPGDPFQVSATPQSEAEIAETIRSLNSAPLGIRAGEPFRISLAGAQEKTAFLRKGKTWARPEGLTPTTHIFKRPMGLVNGRIDMSGSVENEYLCLKIAAAFGLEVNNAWIETFEDQKALIVERFDRRTRPKGGILRLPQEDFLQALGQGAAQKYQQYGGPGMQDCLTLLTGSAERYADMARFLKAQLVFWMIGATDGHAKNFSLHLGPGGFRMTPLYDIISIAPAEASLRHKDIQLAMSAGKNNHYRLDRLHPRHFIETAKAARTPPEVWRRVVQELAETGEAAFERAADALSPDFPDRIASPILAAGRARMKAVTALAGQNRP